jgi:hypothetical protein
MGALCSTSRTDPNSIRKIYRQLAVDIRTTGGSDDITFGGKENPIVSLKKYGSGDQKEDIDKFIKSVITFMKMIGITDVKETSLPELLNKLPDPSAGTTFSAETIDAVIKPVKDRFKKVFSDVLSSTAELSTVPKEIVAFAASMLKAISYDALAARNMLRISINNLKTIGAYLSDVSDYATEKYASDGQFTQVLSLLSSAVKQQTAILEDAFARLPSKEIEDFLLKSEEYVKAVLDTTKSDKFKLSDDLANSLRALGYAAAISGLIKGAQTDIAKLDLKTITLKTLLDDESTLGKIAALDGEKAQKVINAIQLLSANAGMSLEVEGVVSGSGSGEDKTLGGYAPSVQSTGGRMGLPSIQSSGGHLGLGEGKAKVAGWGGDEDSIVKSKVKAKIAERKALLSKFSGQFQQKYNDLVNALVTIAPMIGVEVPTDEKLNSFRRSLEEFSQIYKGQRNIELSLIGLANDAEARDKKGRFMTSLNIVAGNATTLLESADAKAKTPLQTIISTCAEINKLVDLISDETKAKFGGSGDDDVDGGAALNQALLDVTTTARPIAELGAVVAKISFNYFVSNFRRSLEIASTEMTQYEQNYEDSLGKAIHSRLAIFENQLRLKVDENVKLVRERKINAFPVYAPRSKDGIPFEIKPTLNDVKDGALEPAYRGENFDRIQTDRAAVYEDIFKTKEEFYRVVQAIELYLKNYTKVLSSNIEGLRNIKTIIQNPGVIMVSKWYTDETLTALRDAFDLMPAIKYVPPRIVQMAAPVGNYRFASEFWQLGNITSQTLYFNGGKPAHSSRFKNVGEFYKEVFGPAKLEDTIVEHDGLNAGIPQCAYDIEREMEDGTKIIDALKERITNVFNNFSGLKNLINAFIRIGDVLDPSIKKKVFMSPVQIYRALVKFIINASIYRGNLQSNCAIPLISSDLVITPVAEISGVNHQLYDGQTRGHGAADLLSRDTLSGTQVLVADGGIGDAMGTMKKRLKSDAANAQAVLSKNLADQIETVVHNIDPLTGDPHVVAAPGGGVPTYHLIENLGQGPQFMLYKSVIEHLIGMTGMGDPYVLGTDEGGNILLPMQFSLSSVTKSADADAYGFTTPITTRDELTDFKSRFAIEGRFMNYKEELDIFTMMMKAISAKIISTFKLYEVIDAPDITRSRELTISSIKDLVVNNFKSPHRPILGGADDTAKEECVELYFKLPRLVEFYIRFFSVNSNDSPSEMKFYLLPDVVKKPFTELVRIVERCAREQSYNTMPQQTDEYDKKSLVYTNDEIISMISEINGIYAFYNGKSHREIIEELIREVNRAYAIISKGDIDSYGKLTKRERYEPANEGEYQPANVILLPDERTQEDDGNEGAAPSDKFKTADEKKSLVAKQKGKLPSSTQDSLGNGRKDLFKRLRKMIEDRFTEKITSEQIDRDYSGMFDQAKLRIRQAKSNEQKISAASQLIQDTTTNVHSGMLFIMHETVISGITILRLVTDLLKRFRSDVLSSDVDEIAKWIFNKLNIGAGGVSSFVPNDGPGKELAKRRKDMKDIEESIRQRIAVNYDLSEPENKGTREAMKNLLSGFASFNMSMGSYGGAIDHYLMGCESVAGFLRAYVDGCLSTNDDTVIEETDEVDCSLPGMFTPTTDDVGTPRGGALVANQLTADMVDGGAAPLVATRQIFNFVTYDQAGVIHSYKTNATLAAANRVHASMIAQASMPLRLIPAPIKPNVSLGYAINHRPVDMTDFLDMAGDDTLTPSFQFGDYLPHPYATANYEEYLILSQLFGERNGVYSRLLQLKTALLIDEPAATQYSAAVNDTVNDLTRPGAVLIGAASFKEHVLKPFAQLVSLLAKEAAHVRRQHPEYDIAPTANIDHDILADVVGNPGNLSKIRGLITGIHGYIDAPTAAGAAAARAVPGAGGWAGEPTSFPGGAANSNEVTAAIPATFSAAALAGGNARFRGPIAAFGGNTLGAVCFNILHAMSQSPFLVPASYGGGRLPALPPGRVAITNVAYRVMVVQDPYDVKGVTFAPPVFSLPLNLAQFNITKSYDGSRARSVAVTSDTREIFHSKLVNQLRGAFPQRSKQGEPSKFEKYVEDLLSMFRGGVKPNEEKQYSDDRSNLLVHPIWCKHDARRDEMIISKPKIKVDCSKPEQLYGDPAEKYYTGYPYVPVASESAITGITDVLELPIKFDGDHLQDTFKDGEKCDPTFFRSVMRKYYSPRFISQLINVDNGGIVTPKRSFAHTVIPCFSFSHHLYNFIAECIAHVMEIKVHANLDDESAISLLSSLMDIIRSVVCNVADRRDATTIKGVLDIAEFLQLMRCLFWKNTETLIRISNDADAQIHATYGAGDVPITSQDSLTATSELFKLLAEKYTGVEYIQGLVGMSTIATVATGNYVVTTQDVTNCGVETAATTGVQGHPGALMVNSGDIRSGRNMYDKRLMTIAHILGTDVNFENQIALGTGLPARTNYSVADVPGNDDSLIYPDLQIRATNDLANCAMTSTLMRKALKKCNIMLTLHEIFDSYICSTDKGIRQYTMKKKLSEYILNPASTNMFGMTSVTNWNASTLTVGDMIAYIAAVAAGRGLPLAGQQFAAADPRIVAGAAPAALGNYTPAGQGLDHLFIDCYLYGFTRMHSTCGVTDTTAGRAVALPGPYSSTAVYDADGIPDYTHLGLNGANFRNRLPDLLFSHINPKDISPGKLRDHGTFQAIAAAMDAKIQRVAIDTHAGVLGAPGAPAPLLYESAMAANPIAGVAGFWAYWRPFDETNSLDYFNRVTPSNLDFIRRHRTNIPREEYQDNAKQHMDSKFEELRRFTGNFATVIRRVETNLLTRFTFQIFAARFMSLLINRPTPDKSPFDDIPNKLFNTYIQGSFFEIQSALPNASDTDSCLYKLLLDAKEDKKKDDEVDRIWEAWGRSVAALAAPRNEHNDRMLIVLEGEIREKRGLISQILPIDHIFDHAFDFTLLSSISKPLKDKHIFNEVALQHHPDDYDLGTILQLLLNVHAHHNMVGGAPVAVVAANADKIKTLAGMVAFHMIDNQAVLDKLFKSVMLLADSKLVNVDIPSSDGSFWIDFNTLKEICTSLISKVREYITILKSSGKFSAGTELAKYESTDSILSLKSIEKELIDDLFFDSAEMPLAKVSETLNRTMKFITKTSDQLSGTKQTFDIGNGPSMGLFDAAFDQSPVAVNSANLALAPRDPSIAPVRASFGKFVASNMLSMRSQRVQRNKLDSVSVHPLGRGIIGETASRQQSLKYLISEKPYEEWGCVEKFSPTLNYFGHDLSVIEWFNWIMFRYIFALTDQTISPPRYYASLFTPVVVPFFEHEATNAFNGASYSNIVYGAKTNATGYIVHGMPRHILNQTTAAAVRNILMMNTASVDKRTNMVSSLNDLSESSRERMRMMLPYIRQETDFIRTYIEMFKRFMTRTDIDIEIPRYDKVYDNFRLTNEIKDSLAKDNSRLIYVPIDDYSVEMEKNGSYNDYSLSAVFTKNSASEANFDSISFEKTIPKEEVTERVLQIFERIISVVTVMNQGIDMVMKELSSEAVFGQIADKSIDLYRSVNKYLPFAPLSSSIQFANTGLKARKFVPLASSAMDEFQYLYAMRPVLTTDGINAKSLEPTLYWMNESSKAFPTGFTFSNDVYVQFAKTFGQLAKYLYDGLILKGTVLGSCTHAMTRYGKTTVTAIDQDPRSMTILSDNDKDHLPYYVQPAVKPVAGTFNTVDVETRISKVVEKVGKTDDHTIGQERGVEQRSIFIELHTLPIDILSLMREIPLTNIYNYEYTFDKILDETLVDPTSTDQYRLTDDTAKRLKLIKDMIRDPLIPIDEVQFGFTAGRSTSLGYSENALSQHFNELVADGSIARFMLLAGEHLATDFGQQTPAGVHNTAVARDDIDATGKKWLKVIESGFLRNLAYQVLFGGRLDQVAQAAAGGRHLQETPANAAGNPITSIAAAGPQSLNLRPVHAAINPDAPAADGHIRILPMDKLDAIADLSAPGFAGLDDKSINLVPELPLDGVREYNRPAAVRDDHYVDMIVYIMRRLSAVGKLRFDTVIARSLFFITELLNVTRHNINTTLTSIRDAADGAIETQYVERVDS